MDDVERLVAIEEIKQLKARYFRCMDTKDWAGFEAVFSEAAVMDMSEEAGDVVRGASEIAAYVRGHVDPVVTVHHGHMPEITLTSSSTATGIWAMEDVLRWSEGGPFGAMHGFGHYHETYERVDGEWRIATLRLSRLRRDVEPAG
jgi:hypothetical protein